MARPKDENGVTLPPAHRRCPEAGTMAQAALLCLSEDGRFAHLTMSRKITVANAVVDHIVDGNRVPSYINKKDPWQTDNRAFSEVWKKMVAAARPHRPPLQKGAG